jgi:hypothetical protein
MHTLATVTDMRQWKADRGMPLNADYYTRTQYPIESEEPTMTRTQVVQLERRKAGKQETLRRREVRKVKYGKEVR